MRTMLSFDNGEPIAHGIDKRGNKVLTIHITPEQEKSDIEVDSIDELINDSDFTQIAKIMRLTSTEVKLLKKVIQTGRIESLSDRLKLALIKLKERAERRLKTHLNFDKSDEVDRIIPLIGGGGFDRSIFLTGPSGSGKSFLAKEIMKHDLKNRPIIVFSKIDDDESLSDLKKLKISKSSFPSIGGDISESEKLSSESSIKSEIGRPRMIKISLHTEDDLLNLPSNEELKDCVCLFDDIDAFPAEIADFLNAYRNSLLECGRHHNIMVLSTSHQLYNWAKTRVILNESELVCLFPHSNKRSSMLFLRDRMGLGKQEVLDIVNEAMDSGRCLICKLSAPNIIMHNKGIILI